MQYSQCTGYILLWDCSHVYLIVTLHCNHVTSIDGNIMQLIHTQILLWCLLYPHQHIFKLLLNILITFMVKFQSCLLWLSCTLIISPAFFSISCNYVYTWLHVTMWLFRYQCQHSLFIVSLQSRPKWSSHCAIKIMSCNTEVSCNTECCTDNILLKYFLHWNLWSMV